MDLINEFAFILSQNKTPEFDSVLPANSKIRRLYELITSGSVKNDDEASKVIYNSTKADKKYLMLKRNLVQKLSDLVYTQNHEEIDQENYTNMHLQVEKELLIAEKLLLQNVYHNPTKIISKVEQTAEKYFFIDIQVSAARKFRSLYALKGSPLKTAEYDKKVEQLVKYQNYYNASRGMWEKLYSKTKYTPSRIDEIINECKSSVKKIEKWLKLYSSPFIHIYYYKTLILLNHQLNKQEQLFNCLKKMDLLVAKYPFINTKSLKLDIGFYYARYYRDTKQLIKAEQEMEKCLGISDYRAFDKFLLQNLNFDLQIKREKYEKAFEILLDVHSVPQYQFLDSYDKATWTIHEAYLYFILYVNNDKESINQLPLFGKPKALHFFLERSKKWSKDKYGYNITLLIVRVLLYKIYELEDVENEGNNMLVYYHRYLKNYNTRTFIFFYHLAKAVLQGCSNDVLASRKQKLLKQLNELNNSTYDTFEMIPYEHFWNIFMKLCGYN